MKAKDVPDWEGFFRKPKGDYVYLRFSHAAARMLNCDPNFVYGIAFNGNVVKLPLETEVVLCTVQDMAKNCAETARWNQEICGRDEE